MPRKALRCLIEIDIHSVSSPGVWLRNRNDIYLAVKLFRQRRRTNLCAPIFPVHFNEKFRFDKVFFTAYTPEQVADALEYENIEIELIQLSEVRQEGILLGYHESNAKQFLYPYPNFSFNYGTNDREILMERAFDYPGISPKFLFSTKTIIQDTVAPTLDPYEDVQLIKSWEKSLIPTRPSKYRARSARSPSRRSAHRYRRPTVASAYRSRSPSLELQLGKLRLDDREFPPRSDDDRPPFVVGKVKQDLIGRVPGSSRTPRGIHTPRRPRSKSPFSRTPRSRTSSWNSKYYYLDDTYKTKPWYSTVRVNREYSPSVSDDEDDMYNYQNYTRKYRSPSPILYRSSLRDRFDDDLGYSNRISDTVSATLRRNKSLEALDRMYFDDTDLYRSQRRYPRNIYNPYI